MKEKEVEECRRDYELRNRNPEAWYAKQQAEVNAIRAELFGRDGEAGQMSKKG